jgi:DGQHR domain-containing protein
MPEQNLIETKCISTVFSGIPVHTFPMKVKNIVFIYYVAVRGRDEEEGAVQRILNRQRIQSIKDFVLNGNMFYNTFILNWTEENFTPTITDDKIELRLVAKAAQVIDGQHRLAGLESAMQQMPAIGEQDILVSLCVKLSTKEAARIFLNINSEQKPVQKSLIYDLFGEVEDNVDHAVVRASDIAHELNENTDSPFYKAIKYPGSPRGSWFHRFVYSGFQP